MRSLFHGASDQFDLQSVILTLPDLTINVRRNPPEDLPPGGDLLHPRDGVQDVDDEQGDVHERHWGGHPAHASNFSLKGAVIRW